MVDTRINNDAELFELMKETQQNGSDIKKYFHFKAPFWRAIREQIEQNDPVLIDLPVDHIIVSHRGTGSAIYFDGYTVLGKDYSSDPPKEYDVFRLWVKVEHIHLDNDYYDYVIDHSKTSRFSIDVPVSLMQEEFPQKDFDKWVKKVKREKKKLTKNEDVSKLRELIASYPKEAKKFLDEN